jgi:hypothetical protein
MRQIRDVITHKTLVFILCLFVAHQGARQ